MTDYSHLPLEKDPAEMTTEEKLAILEALKTISGPFADRADDLIASLKERAGYDDVETQTRTQQAVTIE